MAKLIQYSVYVWLLLLFCILFNIAKAQPGYKLIIHPVSADTGKITLLNLQTDFNNKTSCIQYVNRLPSLLAIKGYAAASVDSVWEDSAIVSIRLYTGNGYSWQTLYVSDTDYALLSTLVYNAGNFNKQNFSF